MHLIIFILLGLVVLVSANHPPIFTKDMNNFVISENTKVGAVVYKLEAYDPEGSNITFGMESDVFKVDPVEGTVILMKKLDRELENKLMFSVTIKDVIFGKNESNHDNLVKVPVTVIISDENDNVPNFLEIPYEKTLSEETSIDQIVMNITVQDDDSVGEILDLLIIPETNQKLWFRLEIIEATQSLLRANLILSDQLDYNEKKLHQFHITVTDGYHNVSTVVIIHVKDEQNSPPVFLSSLTISTHENVKAGTIITKLVAVDGDKGEPREIFYDLKTNPMDLFFLDGKTGDLQVSKLIDRESLGINDDMINIIVRGREIFNGHILNDSLSSIEAVLQINVEDENDNLPRFNALHYYVSIKEDIPIGSPLSIEINVTDSDKGKNCEFSLSLEDVTEAFDVEPKFVVGSSSISIRVVKNILDYENPNHRNFILLLKAKESDSLISSTTIYIKLEDINDNRPWFTKESYSVSLSENSAPGEIVTTISAFDLDSLDFGTSGIRYKLIGEGTNAFTIDPLNGTIYVASCNNSQAHNNKFECINNMADIPIQPIPPTLNNTVGLNDESTCIDFEKQNEYILTVVAQDNNGTGFTSIMPIRIILMDENDSSPICRFTSRAIINEGDNEFDSPLYIKAYDADSKSSFLYQIKNESISSYFSVEPNSGLISIKNNNFSILSNNGNIVFDVEANDGIYFTSCKVNITVRDINNHAPEHQGISQFSIPKDMNVGDPIVNVDFIDKDSGENAKINYFIRSGSFKIFDIDPQTGIIYLARNLSLEDRSIYNLEVIAADQGTPSLSSTSIFTVSINKPDVAFSTDEKFFRIEVDENNHNFTNVISIPIKHVWKLKTMEEFSYHLNGKPSIFDRYGKNLNYSSWNSLGLTIADGNLKISSQNKSSTAFIIIELLATAKSTEKSQQIKMLLEILIQKQYDYSELIDLFDAPDYTYFINITEELPIGSKVGVLQPKDVNVVYEMEENQFLTIKNNTGYILTKSRIEYEIVESFDVKVDIFRLDMPSHKTKITVSCNIIINILDNNLIFAESSYNFTIDKVQAGIQVGQIIAERVKKQEFGVISYKLFPRRSAFQIDEGKGIITIQNSEYLDEEISKEYFVIVTATENLFDIRKTASVLVRIVVVNTSMDSVTFKKDIYSVNISSIPPFYTPIPILKVETVHFINDGSLIYELESSDYSKIFSINSKSGIITLQTEVPLTSIEHFDFKVRAIWKNSTTHTLVIVNVSLVNTERPTFVEPFTMNNHLELSNDTGLNEILFKVSAADFDIGKNGEILYYFRTNEMNVHDTSILSIHEITGNVKISSHMNVKNDRIVLVAKDNGFPNAFETLKLLSFSFKNEKQANFPKNITKLYVPYNGQINLKIASLETSNTDERTFFSIVYGNDDKNFEIDSDSGELFVKKQLEKGKKYHICVFSSISQSILEFENEDLELCNHNSSFCKVEIQVDNIHFNNTLHSTKESINAGVNMKASIGEVVYSFGKNEKLSEYQLIGSIFYKFGIAESRGLIVPSPFSIDNSGVLRTASHMAEYDQDRFIIEIWQNNSIYIGKLSVHVWVFNSNQLTKIIFSKSPSKVEEQSRIIVDLLSKITNTLIVVTEIRYHVENSGRVNMDWCDLFFIAVDAHSNNIVPVSNTLKTIDAQYEIMKKHYVTFGIGNIVPAHQLSTNDDMDLALAAIIALMIVLFVGSVSLAVLSCCLKVWITNFSTTTTKQQGPFLRKQTIGNLNTTDNPLWIEQRLKLYEEQELTMQIFSDPDMQPKMENFNTYNTLNSYATIGLERTAESELVK